MRKHKFTRIEPVQDAEDRWTAFVHDKFTNFLSSHQWGDEEVEEPRSFTGGVPLYRQQCRESAEKGYDGFVCTN
jgi:hypothetical protein